MQPGSAEDNIVEDIFAAGPADAADLMAILEQLPGSRTMRNSCPCWQNRADKTFGVEDIALGEIRAGRLSTRAFHASGEKAQRAGGEAVMICATSLLIAARGRATEYSRRAKNEISASPAHRRPPWWTSSA